MLGKTVTTLELCGNILQVTGITPGVSEGLGSHWECRCAGSNRDYTGRAWRRDGTTTPGVLRAPPHPRYGSYRQDYMSHGPPRLAGSGAMAAQARPGAAAAPIPRGPAG